MEHYFSIIIPVYNAEDYIEECLESILKQQYTNYQIIIIDDGSVDESAIICDRYKEKMPDIFTVVHKKNEGQLSARIAGLKNADGEYVCFIDADDTIQQDYLMSLNSVIEKEESDLIVFRFTRVDENNNIIDFSESVFSEGNITRESFILKILQGSSLNSMCIKVFKRTIVDLDRDYSAWYSIKYGEDLLQSLPIVEKSKLVYYLDKSLYNYRMHNSSTTHVFQPGKYKSLIVVRPELYTLLQRLHMDSKENVNIFFRYYLKSLWKCIYKTIIHCDEKLSIEIFGELLQCEYVGKAKNYLSNSRISIDAKVGLSLFYQKHWNRLERYVKTQNGLKALIKRIYSGKKK